jgi:hypothetical protein
MAILLILFTEVIHRAMGQIGTMFLLIDPIVVKKDEALIRT